MCSLFGSVLYTLVYVSQYARDCCAIVPGFADQTIVQRCAMKVLDDKDSPMDMAYGMTQEDVLFSPGLRVGPNNYLLLVV